MKIMYFPQTTQRAHSILGNTHTGSVTEKLSHTIFILRRRHNHHTALAHIHTSMSYKSTYTLQYLTIIKRKENNKTKIMQKKKKIVVLSIFRKKNKSFFFPFQKENTHIKNIITLNAQRAALSFFSFFLFQQIFVLIIC